MEYMQIHLYKRIEDERRADQRRDAELWRLLRRAQILAAPFANRLRYAALPV